MALGPGSIMLIVGAGLIVFGPKKLPELGKSLGETLREFKKATNGLVSDDEQATETKIPKKAQRTLKVVRNKKINKSAQTQQTPHYKISKVTTPDDQTTVGEADHDDR